MRALVAPVAYFLFPGVEHGAVRVVCGELRVERREGVLEG